jgi:hypothetical protein
MFCYNQGPLEPSKSSLIGFFCFMLLPVLPCEKTLAIVIAEHQLLNVLKKNLLCNLREVAYGCQLRSL